MLYFTVGGGGHWGPADIQWHVGEKRPTIYQPNRNLNLPQREVLMVTADGDELEFIRRRFQNLPILPRPVPVVIWQGDFAKFIYDNLDE